MKVYRGYDKNYEDYGSPSDQPIWVTSSIFYATKYAERVEGRVVQFDLDPNDLKLYPGIHYTPVPKDFKRKVLKAGCNACTTDYGSDCMGAKQLGWSIFDKSILKNPEIIIYFDYESK